MPPNEPSILLVTSEDDLTADLIILELRRRGLPFHRLNCENFPLRISGTWSNKETRYISVGKDKINLNKISSVWYRRMPMPDLTALDANANLSNFIMNESRTFLNGLLGQLDTLWVNKISSVSAAENKILQLDTAQKVHLKTPKTIISNDSEAVKSFLNHYSSAICKPLSIYRIVENGDDWMLYTETMQEPEVAGEDSIQVSPFIIQEQIERKREVRLTVVGNQIFACLMEIKDSERNIIDLHLVDDENIVYEPIKVPDKIKKSTLQLLKTFDLLYGCLDFILTEHNDWIFLELNPSGQWGWIEKKIGFPITKSIVKLLKGDNFVC